MVAQVAAEEPDTAAKMPQPMTFTCVSRPGSHCTQGEMPRNISSDNLVRKRISPIQMNNGSAASVHDALALQVAVASTLPSGTDVVSAIATKPTSPSAIAIQTPLASSTIMTPSRMKANSTMPRLSIINLRRLARCVREIRRESRPASPFHSSAGGRR